MPSADSPTRLLADRELVVAVSGGVACYKSAAMVSQLVQQGANVSVVMTSAAEKFIGAATFEALTGRPVASHSFSSAQPLGPHIVLAEQADLICVAPATANILGKVAHGIADDLLTTLLLAFTGPTVFAPAMNCEMWAKPSVQRNVQQLTDDGYHMVGPEEGWLSCRKRGRGRMSSPEQIMEAIVQHLPPRAESV